MLTILRGFFLVGVLIIAAGQLSAQEMSWRRHKKNADTYIEQGKYYEAAEEYRKAWTAKRSKLELIKQAAENYDRVNDYRKAADAYQYLQDNLAEFPGADLKYAMALKQDGSYEKARGAFQRFIDAYTGTDKAVMQEIIATEIAGIDLAMSFTARDTRNLEILQPGVNINTDADEFAPLAISGDRLQFCSAMGGRVRLYESVREGRSWGKGDDPTAFPVIQKGHYGNSSLSPDGERLYFTICNDDTPWQGLDTRCEIFVTSRTEAGWSAPERLPDFVNVSGKNATHPFVFQRDGLEYLFFVSNMQGSVGGTDIWYTVRPVGSKVSDFVMPVNLGRDVNSVGNEITPFYSVDEGTLYFASRGWASLGGYDIFKSTGFEKEWSRPMNLGIPVNTGSDDFGYTTYSGGGAGFFVSNRVFGSKTNTRHTDIFEFGIANREVILKADVVDKNSSQPLSNIVVSVYQQYSDGVENLLTTKEFRSGEYSFAIGFNNTYRIEVNADGYKPDGYVFKSNNPSLTVYGQQLALEAVEVMQEVVPEEKPEKEVIAKPEKPAVKSTTPKDMPDEAAEAYTARGLTEPDVLEYTSKAPRHEGVYYKVQVAAIPTFSPTHTYFRRVNLSGGSWQTEFLTERKLTRALIGDFFTEAEGKTALAEVRKSVSGAYLVKYENGVRVGKVMEE
jgi:peptidoglycan-associated lipoprotein